MVTGRVLTINGAPLSEANISLAETPYNVLAQTNISGHFKALGVCFHEEEMLVTKEGFVPMTRRANVLTPTTATINVKMEIGGTCLDQVRQGLYKALHILNTGTKSINILTVSLFCLNLFTS